MTGVSTPCAQRFDERPEPHFAQRAFRVRPVDLFRAEFHVRFERAREKERILQHDAEHPPQILQVHLANVHAIEQNLAALNVVEAQQQLNDRRLARAGVPNDRQRLARLHAEGNVAKHPILFLRSCAAVIGEPHVAEFNFAARRRQAHAASLAKRSSPARRASQKCARTPPSPPARC